MIVLKSILNDLAVICQKGDTDISFENIEFDSRKIKENDVFVALKGTQVDGHLFIQKAIEQGAVAVVCEELPEDINPEICYLQVQNSAVALGKLAAAYFDYPSQKLKLIGITGTNGKTSTATLLYQLFIKLGYKVGLISTICNLVHTKQKKATHTTPNSLEINKLIAEMINEGCDYCFMEVSSHAIHQHRIAGLSFAGAVFTNITQDHLDYHKTFAEYIKAKKIFFDHLGKNTFALANTDDKNSAIMLQNTKAKKLSFALKSMATYQAKVLEIRTDGMLLSFNGTEFWTSFMGIFNVYNLLSVFGVAVELGQNKEEVLALLSTLKNVAGRFQTIVSKSGKMAIIDYAHTPDAVENVLQTIEKIAEKTGGKIITVIGAGGNRDKSKRPIMAAIATKMSQHVILTSDNPRDEDPESIIEDMRKGVLPPNNKKILQISNRKEAIRTACTLAQKNDIVLIAGKGHENYQEIKGVKHHFDDTEVVNEIFENQ